MRSNKKNFIKRLKAGKEDAIEYVIDEYLPFVKSIVQPILAPLNRAGIIDECLNDVFLSAWENAKKFRGSDPDSFKNWLGAIARFKAIDYYRKITRNAEIAADYLEIPVNNQVESAIIQLENSEELLQFLQQLNPLDQKIMVMKFLLDFHSDEIARQLGMSRSAVDNRIYRNKKKLEQKVKSISGEVFSIEGYL